MQSSACVTFKNLIKTSWNPETSDHPMLNDDRNYVRSGLFDMILNASHLSYKVLEDALSCICQLDFPDNWSDLLNQMVDRLGSCFDHQQQGGGGDSISPNDLRRAERCMSACHAAIGKYRHISDLTNTIAEGYHQIHKALYKPLLASLNAGRNGVQRAISNQNINDGRAAAAFLAQTLEVIHDMIHLDISEEYEEALPQYALAYQSLLELHCEQFERSDDAGSIAEVKIKTLAILSLHIQKYGAEITPAVMNLAHAAWNVLRPDSEDAVIIGVIQFLEQIAHSQSLSQMLEPMLEPIIERCIMPNLELDDFDVDTFKTDPSDFIERDVEGTDQWTRRRAATELIRAILDGFSQRVGQIFTSAIQNMLQQYYSNQQQNWKRKDAAIFLVTALASRGTASSSRGAVGRLTNLVDVPEFYTKEIMPELEAPKNDNNNNSSSSLENINNFAGQKLHLHQAILKSSAIRFVSTFRNHIPVQQYYHLLEMLGAWLRNENQVVYSYAAHAIERLLSDPRVCQTREMNLDQQLAGHLLQHLCVRLSSNLVPNEHLARGCATVLKLCNGDVMSPFVGDVTLCIHNVLMEALKNPENPQFTHYLFECFSWMIRRCPNFARDIEATIWETLMKILIQNILEMMPYSLQIVAQLLDTIQPNSETPECYVQLLQPLLSEEFLNEKGNVPAIVRLSGSFLRQSGNAISNQGNIVSRMFEVACNLINSKRTDHDGFLLVVTMMMNLQTDACNDFILDVFKAILSRLQGSRTTKFERAGILGTAAIVSKYSIENIANMLEQIQGGLFEMYLRRFLFLDSHKMTSRFGQKCALVVLSQVADELFKKKANPQLYSECVCSGVKILMLIDSQKQRQNSLNQPAGSSSSSGSSSTGGGTTSLRSNRGSNTNISGGSSAVSPTTGTPTASSSSSQSGFGSPQGGNDGGNIWSSSSSNENFGDSVSASELRTTTLAETGFTNAFCPLEGARRDAEDPFPNCENPVQQFIQTIRQHNQNDGNLVGTLRNNMPQDVFQFLGNAMN